MQELGATTRRLILPAVLWLHSRPAHIAVILAVIMFSFSGSVSLIQVERADPSKRIMAATGGRLSPKGMAGIVAVTPPFAAKLALAHFPGVPQWSPPRTPGWERYDIERPPALIWGELSFDEARTLNALLPLSPVAKPPMAPFKLPAAGAERERALLCLSQAVYYEAGFESGEGQEAVAQVVLNRLRHPAYPKSVCGVVYQGSQRATGCQFSFTCDGSLKRPVSQAAWQRSRFVAEQALAGFVFKPVGAATHYHADYVFPYWAVTLAKLEKLGAHIFYRMTGPSGAPSAFVGRYAGGELNLPASVLTGGDARTPDAPSAIAPPEKPATRTITLQTGGETRTYTIAAPPEAGAPTPGLGNPLVIQPSRRAPTPDEVRAINEKLQRFEDEQKAVNSPRP